MVKDFSRELLELITRPLKLRLNLGLNKKQFSELKILGLKVEFWIAVGSNVHVWMENAKKLFLSLPLVFNELLCP